MKLTPFIVFLVISVYGDNVNYPKYDNLNREFTLVTTPDNDHLALNDKFEIIARQMGFLIKVSPIINGVYDTIKVAKKHPYVINLKISIKELHSDYRYKAFLYSNLLCATNCDDSNQTYTRLISESILNYTRLLQIIENEDFETEDYIQICLPRNTPDLPISLLNQNMNWPLKTTVSDCAANIEPDKSSYLALITNEPPYTDTLLPTIFYQTPYILPETKDRFPNSISLSTTWQPLKYAFKEFLKHMAWYRVAILSDDSAYSQDFVEELVPLFIKEGITITDQKCSGRFCDFTQPLNLLKDAHARIIILNVDKVNANKLVDSINALNIRDVTWVVRDWPFTEHLKIMRNVFSITLSPVFEEKDKFYPYLSSIREGLKIINRIYKTALGNKEEFQRLFSNETNKLRYFKTNAYIIRMHVNSDPTLVAVMTIEGEATEIVNFTDKLYKERIPPDTPQNCIVRSRNFFKPCSHEELLLLVCVCVMFVLSLLVLIVCFNKYRNRRFYNRFS